MYGRISLFLVVLCLPAAVAEDRDARTIVREAIDHWRGLSSYSEMTMIIHRPDWERTMKMRAWTKGQDHALVRVVEPRKDRGTGTLTDDKNVWTYSPKVNRVLKVPSSMMGQSWLGSDFSNKDIAKADDIVDDYEHTLIDSRDRDGILVHEIESVPNEDAAVVWGREVLSIRDDHVVLQHDFYDQDGELVKSLKTLDVAEMGGRTIASRQRMQSEDEPGEWTEISIDAIDYAVELPNSLFTLSSLRNPRN